MSNNVYPDVNDLSFTNSGIVHKFISRLRLGGTSAKQVTRKILYLIVITWLPLLALSALQGLAFGEKVDIPFWKDFAIHSKFLIILPLLMLAEAPFDLRIKEITAQFFKSGILDGKDLGKFEEIRKKVKSLTDSI
jgi:hypothetical protein